MIQNQKILLAIIYVSIATIINLFYLWLTFSGLTAVEVNVSSNKPVEIFSSIQNVSIMLDPSVFVNANTTGMLSKLMAWHDIITSLN